MKNFVHVTPRIYIDRMSSFIAISKSSIALLKVYADYTSPDK